MLRRVHDIGTVAAIALLDGKFYLSRAGDQIEVSLFAANLFGDINIVFAETAYCTNLETDRNFCVTLWRLAMTMLTGKWQKIALWCYAICDFVDWSSNR